MTSRGFDSTITNAFGQFVFRLPATSLMISTLMWTRSSRDMPGLRGTPAVMITTSAPLQSAHSVVPLTAQS